ncbi:MAG: hypothetical protein WC784_01440 [Candidatus Shapirobacteria bacterium]|jgi:hypothetical protein
MSSLDSIDLHVRTYRSALKSNLEVTLHSLTNSYLKIDSILHPLASDPQKPDSSAIIYSLLRLPKVIDRTQKVVIGQNPQVFQNAGFKDILKWHSVTTSARRRTAFFDKKTGTYAVFISSISDLDDLVNLLLAYQIEWNKFHQLAVTAYPTLAKFKQAVKDKSLLEKISFPTEDWQKIKIALGRNWRLRLKRMYQHPQDFRLRLLAGSWIDYTKTTQRWWKNIAINVADNCHISHQKIYFVSSNSHSLLNLITGFPLKSKEKLLKLAPKNYSELSAYIHQNDFLYYLSKYLSNDQKYQQEFQKIQDRLGILSIPSTDYLSINTQIFPIKNLLKSKYLDSRLKISKPSKIAQSDTLIFNIDYPLGFAAYHILNEVLENVAQVKGVYVLGKAAVLNSEIGDLEIPRLVFDEHTQNSYFFKNCFNTFFPYTNTQGSILTNQKSVTVLGTFLENEALLKKYFQNNLTVIEMETGPYLSAITEATYDQQTPKSTLVDLNSAPFDVGVINYTSDTPYSRAKNLGAGALNLAGIEPVYLGSLAILQRIINLEENS